MRLLIAWIFVAAAWASLIAAATGTSAALIGCVGLCAATYFMVWGWPLIQRQFHARPRDERAHPTLHH